MYEKKCTAVDWDCLITTTAVPMWHFDLGGAGEGGGRLLSRIYPPPSLPAWRHGPRTGYTDDWRCWGLAGTEYGLQRQAGPLGRGPVLKRGASNAQAVLRTGGGHVSQHRTETRGHAARLLCCTCCSTEAAAWRGWVLQLLLLFPESDE